MSDTPETPNAPIPDASTQGVPTWAKRLVIGLVVSVAVFFGAILLYAKVINDSPDEFTSADIDAALSAEAEVEGEETTVDAATTPPVASTAPVEPAAPVPTTGPLPTVPTAPAGSDWVATDASQVGYRVEEVLFGVDTTAVGRTNEVTGTMTINGTAVTATEFTVDVASISSDESRRDDAFSGRIMSTDEFPTATFVLTEPIELGSEPADGVEVTATATGELTLRGSTQPVAFEVNAKQENGLIGVQGSIPVAFADYGIANPSFGGISTEDNGLVEFVLVFEPA